MKKIILASSSPARQLLMQRLGLTFEIIIPNIDETARSGEEAHTLVERLAVEKAAIVAREQKNALVIGCDQVAVLDQEIVSKPLSHKNAVNQLLKASGNIINFYTGLCLINTDTHAIQCCVEPFQVHFKTLSLDTIERYLTKEQPYHCAGSIRSEGIAVALFERMIGNDPNALMGLPLIQLTQMLAKENVFLF